MTGYVHPDPGGDGGDAVLGWYDDPFDSDEDWETWAEHDLRDGWDLYGLNEFDEYEDPRELTLREQINWFLHWQLPTWWYQFNYDIRHPIDWLKRGGKRVDEVEIPF